MIILLVLGYVVVGAFELYMWSDRPWKKVLAYLHARPRCNTDCHRCVKLANTRSPATGGYLRTG